MDRCHGSPPFLGLNDSFIHETVHRVCTLLYGDFRTLDLVIADDDGRRNQYASRLWCIGKYLLVSSTRVIYTDVICHSHSQDHHHIETRA